MYDIYFYEAFEEEAESLSRYLPEGVRAGFTWKTIQESGDALPPSRLISIRTQSVLPLNWAGHLSGILSRSTGYDHILRYRQDTGKNIPAGHLPLYCNRSVAEQAMLLWMTLLRKLPRQLLQFKNFHRDGLTGYECKGKKLLVVGVGNIGSEIVKIGQGLEMSVKGVDLVKKHDFVEYTSIEEGIGDADIVVCSMNLNQTNYGYFSYDLLKKARRGVLFINIARGEMSPSEDLLRLLDEGHLGGAAMDVYNQETRLSVALRNGSRSDDPKVRATLAMADRPNVIFTPHNAFNTHEAVERKSEQSVQQAAHFIKEGRFIWEVPQE